MAEQRIFYKKDAQGVPRVVLIHIVSSVSRELAEQVEYGMSYDEVLALLGPTGDIGSGTIVQEYMLSDGGTAYFSYTIYPDNVFRVTHIRIVDPGE